MLYLLQDVWNRCCEKELPPTLQYIATNNAIATEESANCTNDNSEIKLLDELLCYLDTSQHTVSYTKSMRYVDIA